MSYRIDAPGKSSSWLQIRVTPEERAEVMALARYLKCTVSDLVRQLVAQERARLVADGKRPPKR